MIRHLCLIVTLATAALLMGLLPGCGNSETRPVDPQPENPFEDFVLGRADALEVVTWNLHNFAEDAGRDEVALAAQVIEALGADVVAVQEIAESSRFDDLLEALPAWSGVQANTDNYQNLGYVWLDSTVTVRSLGEVRPQVDEAWRAFPRCPLVLEITWQGHDLALINNHFKCCGDGILESSNPNDEETRRQLACDLLEEHIAGAYAGQPVILLGDLNDNLADAWENNVFTTFLAQPEAYRFADQEVAEGPANGWSWGPGRSHLDHIMVTAPLFSALEADGAACRTVRVDRALPNGQFGDDLSDHAPVVLILPGAFLP